MWRSLFLALGVMAIIVGLESMVIDSANLYAASEAEASSFVNPTGTPSPATKVWKPKEWFPWVITAVGAVVIIYAFTLPKRFGKAAE